MFRVAAYTDIGPRKESNQDSCCVETAETSRGQAAIMSVCDGVGGLSAGEIASFSVITWFAEWFEIKLSERFDQLADNPDKLLDFVQNEWTQGLLSMNSAICKYGKETNSRLGTTCMTIFLFDGRYLIAHVGDSRIYKFSEKRMDVLTADQTWVAQEVARGNITPETARFHPKRNIILQAVGSQLELAPVFSRGCYSVGDAFMACCDGFRNELFDAEILDGFGRLDHADADEIQKNCEALVRLVLQRGERDNITVACVSCQEKAAESVERESK